MASPSNISVISPQTKLTGTIESEDVLIVAGHIEGDVHGRKIIIKDKGRVDGNISCRSLVIEAGGLFDGRSMMTTSPEELEFPANKNGPPIPEVQNEPELD